MNTFSNISVKIEIAKKFRAFSKSIASNHSEALFVMISFFVKNGISPHEDCGPNFLRLEKNILKRINTIIGFLKIKEKNYSKPTLEILTALIQSSLKEFESRPRFMARELILEKSTVISDDLRVEKLNAEINLLKLQIIEKTELVEKLLIKK